LSPKTSGARGAAIPVFEQPVYLIDPEYCPASSPGKMGWATITDLDNGQYKEIGMINDTASKPYGVPKLWDGYGFPFVFIPVLVGACAVLLLLEQFFS